MKKANFCCSQSNPPPAPDRAATEASAECPVLHARYKALEESRSKRERILTLKADFKVLEFQKGKPGIAVRSVEGLGAVFGALIAATAAGELDGLLAAATGGEDRGTVKGKKPS